MSVLTTRLDEYVAVEAVDHVLSVFTHLDDPGKILGRHFQDRNPASVLDPTISNEFDDDDGNPVGPHVEYADGQASLLAALMLRLVVDNPATVAERAMFYERRAAEMFARHAPGEEATDG